MTWGERLRYDARYGDNWSLALDIAIPLRTVGQFSRPEPTPVVDAMNVERARKRSAPSEGREA